MTRTLTISLGAVVFLAGCPPIDDPVCTDEARASVSVSVVDDAGTFLSDATVVFSVDGGADEPCELVGDTSFVCGWERAGEIVVKASKAGLMGDNETVVVEMDADGCHVVGQAIEILLEDECDDPPPAMLVTVFQPDGVTPAVGEAVLWGIQNADMAPQPCDEEASGVWACAYGHSGALEVYVEPAEGDPYQGVLQNVDVAEGVCGPDTEEVSITLQYLPD